MSSERKVKMKNSEKKNIPENFYKPWFNSDVALRCSKTERLFYVNRKTLAAFSPFFNAMFFGDFEEKKKDIVDLECHWSVMRDILRLLHHIDRTYVNGIYYPDHRLYGMYKVADMYDIPIVRDMVRQRLSEIDAGKAYKIAFELDLEKEKRDALPRMSAQHVIQLVNQDNDFMFSNDDVRGLLKKCNVNGVASPNELVAQSNKKNENFSWSIPRNFDISWSTSDARLRTSNKKDLHVNKSVLSTFSPYFHAKFSEKDSESKDVFEIDVQHAIFVEILQILHHVDRKFTKRGQMMYDAAMLKKLYKAAVTFDISVIIKLCKQQLLRAKPSEAFEVSVALNLPKERTAILKNMSLPEVTAFLQKSSTFRQSLFSLKDMEEVLEKMRKQIAAILNCRSCSRRNLRKWCGHNTILFYRNR